MLAGQQLSPATPLIWAKFEDGGVVIRVSVVADTGAR